MQTAASSEKTKPSPFGTSFQLEKTSVSSSVSESCRHETVQTVRAGSATSSSHSPLCSCGSLTEWSSLQLQEEHLLGVNRKNGQDMVVVVLTRTDNEASPQLQEKQGTACKVAAADKQKSRLSLGGHSARSSTGGISVAQVSKEEQGGL